MNYSLHTDVEDFRQSLNQIVTYDLEDDPLQSIDTQQTDEDGDGKVSSRKMKNFDIHTSTGTGMEQNPSHFNFGYLSQTQEGGIQNTASIHSAGAVAVHRLAKASARARMSRMKKNQESISSLEQRLKQQKERFGKNDLNVASILSVLAEQIRSQGDYIKSIDIFMEVLSIQMDILGDGKLQIYKDFILNFFFCSTSC